MRRLETARHINFNSEKVGEDPDPLALGVVEMGVDVDRHHEPNTTHAIQRARPRSAEVLVKTVRTSHRLVKGCFLWHFQNSEIGRAELLVSPQRWLNLACVDARTRVPPVVQPA